MSARDDLGTDLLTAVTTAQLTDRRSGWVNVADRLMSYGWGRLPKAPLVVVNPTDPAVIDRVARALYAHDEDREALAWDTAQSWLLDEYRRAARVALAALAGDQR